MACRGQGVNNPYWAQDGKAFCAQYMNVWSGSWRVVSGALCIHSRLCVYSKLCTYLELRAYLSRSPAMITF